MQLKSPSEVKSIVASFSKIFKTRDSGNLTKAAYGFIHIASGFIAHYDIHGFREEYSNVNQLRQEIFANADMNQLSNFRTGERDYEYYMQKRDIYNQIVAIASEGLYDNEN